MHLVSESILVEGVGTEAQEVFECQVSCKGCEALPERPGALLLDNGATTIVDACSKAQLVNSGAAFASDILCIWRRESKRCGLNPTNVRMGEAERISCYYFLELKFE